MSEELDVDKFYFKVPLWIVANDARHYSTDFCEFTRAGVETEASEACLFLFTRREYAERFIRSDPSLADHEPVSLDKPQILVMLDDFERIGVTDAAFDSMPRGNAELADFKRIRAALATLG